MVKFQLLYMLLSRNESWNRVHNVEDPGLLHWAGGLDSRLAREGKGRKGKEGKQAVEDIH